MSLRRRCARRTVVPSTTTLNSETGGATATREVDFHELAVPSHGMEVEDAPEVIILEPCAR